MTTFEPAYNPALNTNIPVPLSKNKLVPDYEKTSYLHTANNGKTITIEMQGTRAKDFAEAFKELGISKADVLDYTWHHMDDFRIENGKAVCTMQLVKSSAHNEKGLTGMQHSGSVAQWKAFYEISVYP